MTKIKICGLVRQEDIQAANEYKPDYVGFVVFVPKSKRNLSIEEARILKEGLDPEIRTVAVTVSPDRDQIRQIEEAAFDLVQIHGELDDQIRYGEGIPILRACNVKDGQQLKEALKERKPERDIEKDSEKYDYVLTGGKDRIVGYVFDSRDPGSGKSFDWSLIADLDRGQSQLFLAGGINEDNVEEAIRIVRPDVIDLSSSVELPAIGGRAGGKDPDKMRTMIRKVHHAE